MMNPYRKESKTGMIVKRVILVTFVLAVIEVMILFVIHKRNTPETALNKPNENTGQLPTEKKDTFKGLAKNMVQSTLPQVIKKDIVVKKDTTAATKPVSKTSSSVNQELQAVNAVSDENKRKDAKVVKPVDSNKMFQILNEVRLEKLQANNPTKCISIQIINNSNAENGFMIANYLRNNGYVISGREVVAGSQKGIQVDATGTCIKLSVGDLE